MFSRALIVLVAATSLALGSALPRALPSGSTTCGSNSYTASELTTAINGGVKYLNDNNLQDDYPHQYYTEASEHITLKCTESSPWYEYPLVPGGGVYTSTSSDYTSPGTDRVIFTGSGVYCATVTHTGAASYDGFVACKND
ncbi:Ribonuclease/ribotoxin [Athelia psychrophila]|uniref:Ribonuclease/ribotoxin n=1 Tax=Athelia psychrophila TaxID=1759441 RepID=A0A165XL08_9AGAM|nr:Ribonuclease/ribotoxin [Fibularhizoctonia sp. CBS 109695]